MTASTDYTGTHKVVLPPDFMNSIDAAVDLYEDDIAAVAANLSVSGLKSDVGRGAIRIVSVGVFLWFLPVGWSTCI
jgi:hypothetical protein